mgnify:CR=1 FL=1
MSDVGAVELFAQHTEQGDAYGERHGASEDAGEAKGLDTAQNRDEHQKAVDLMQAVHYDEGAHDVVAVRHQDGAPYQEEDRHSSVAFGQQQGVVAGLEGGGAAGMTKQARGGAVIATGRIVIDFGRCKACELCIDACPTSAIQADGLDATRCISYFTIELKEEIPSDVQGKFGNWVFGCDICQEVCPWNRFAPHECLPEFTGRRWNVSAERVPVEILRMTATDFQQVFGGTALERTGRDVMRRNAAIVLGNLRQLEGDAELLVALRDDSPLVRSAAGWALCRRGGAVGLAAVREQLEREPSAEVAVDLRLSLSERGES